MQSLQEYLIENIDEGKMDKWKSEFYYTYSVLDVTRFYLPEIKSIFTNLSSFTKLYLLPKPK